LLEGVLLPSLFHASSLFLFESLESNEHLLRSIGALFLEM
jgi:hypothetical protein